jgi:hypothetical protein
MNVDLYCEQCSMQRNVGKTPDSEDGVRRWNIQHDQKSPTVVSHCSCATPTTYGAKSKQTPHAQKLISKTAGKAIPIAYFITDKKDTATYIKMLAMLKNTSLGLHPPKVVKIDMELAAKHGVMMISLSKIVV